MTNPTINNIASGIMRNKTGSLFHRLKATRTLRRPVVTLSTPIRSSRGKSPHRKAKTKLRRAKKTALSRTVKLLKLANCLHDFSMHL